MKPPRFKKPKFGKGKVRAKPRDLETPIHVSILEFLRWVMPKGTLIHHSPNELGISSEDAKKSRAKATAMGMVAGWPDLEVFYPNADGWGFFFVEVKSELGVLSPFQKIHRDACRAMGIRYCVAKSINDLEEFLEWEEIPHKLKRTGLPLSRRPT